MGSQIDPNGTPSRYDARVEHRDASGPDRTPPVNLSGRRLVHVANSDSELARHLSGYLEAFTGEGLEVIGISPPGPSVGRLATLGLRHISLPSSSRPGSSGGDLVAVARLTRLLRRLRPDIVHTYQPGSARFDRVAARAAGVPGIVNTVHDLDLDHDLGAGGGARAGGGAQNSAPLQSPRQSPRRASRYSFDRLVTACSQFELVRSPDDLAALTALGVPPARLVALGSGVDLGRFRPRRTTSDIARARFDLGVDPSAVVVGIVGRLVWQNEYRELFSAAERIRTLRPEVVFVMVGPDGAAVDDALPPGDRESAAHIGNVVWAGHRHNMADLYSGFDVFAQLSYRSGLTRSAMEALACGLPIVATDVPGSRQIVSHEQNGYLVPAHDVGALTEAVVGLAGDPARRGTMGARSRARAEADFDGRRTVQITLDVYRRLPARRSPSPGRP